MESRKRKRTSLDVGQKREIINYAIQAPKSTQQKIADHFSALWDVEVKRRTVSDILSQKDKFDDENIEQSAKKQKTAKHADLEEALFLWFSHARSQNIPKTDKILREKAKHFGKQFDISDFSYSNGWLQRFKSRHGISRHAISDADLPLAVRKHATARRPGKVQRERMLGQARGPVSATQTSLDIAQGQMLSPLPTSRPIPNVATDKLDDGLLATKSTSRLDRSSMIETAMETSDRMKSPSEIKTENPDELDEQEGLDRELNNLEKFQQQQKMIEEANKKKKELLSRTINERQRKAIEESKKLTHIQRELSHLDTILSADVSIIREKIECSSRDFAEAQKRYERIEKMFIAAKIDLQRKSEIKDQLTEHLYTVINKNEVRKAQKLGELMKEMEMEPEAFDLPDVLPLATFNTLNQLQTLRPKKAASSETKPTDISTDSTLSSVSEMVLENKKHDESTKATASLDCSQKETCENVENPSNSLVIVSVTGSAQTSNFQNANQPENLTMESKIESRTDIEDANVASDSKVQDTPPTECSGLRSEQVSDRANSPATVNNEDTAITRSQNTDKSRSQSVNSVENGSPPSVQYTGTGSPASAHSAETPTDNTESKQSEGEAGGGTAVTDMGGSSTSSMGSWLFPFARVKQEPAS
ncbi:hypothetical protein ScPMuIL_010454 [Solemya velum]